MLNFSLKRLNLKKSSVLKIMETIIKYCSIQFIYFSTNKLLLVNKKSQIIITARITLCAQCHKGVVRASVQKSIYIHNSPFPFTRPKGEKQPPPLTPSLSSLRAVSRLRSLNAATRRTRTSKQLLARTLRRHQRRK
jgi:hypothetical protein